MQNKINLGIIGKNFGYHVIYKAFSKNKKYKIKAFSFKKKINKIKIPKSIKIYPSWKQMKQTKEINAVVIATPPMLHKKIIKFAIKNNKHVFCEKPFTRSLRESNEICNIIRRRKKIFHMVNYEFSEIDAFNFFKSKILKNIKINKIFLNWFININKRPSTNWKENHSKGGGIIYNYVCHAIYYLEFLFGRIIAVKTNILSAKKNKIKMLEGVIFFNNSLSATLKIKVGLIKEKINPIHQLNILDDKKNYVLETKLDSLSDQFRLIRLNRSSKKIEKILFSAKKNKNDFRINPTFQNSKKFSNWILRNKIQKPNFFDGKRMHLIINQMLISSQKKKKIYI